MAFFCITFFCNSESWAGTVRTAYGDGITMMPVNLRMGQSTVLRFTEKPKKVILGNSNYYSVEFIDNDLAIQPLGAVTTNLFVYGMTTVYGFILRTNQITGYDDLVQVDLKGNKINSQPKLVEKQSLLRDVSEPQLKFNLGQYLRATLTQIQRFDKKDFYVIDFVFENTSKHEINLEKMKLSLSHGKIKIFPQEFILKNLKINSAEMTAVRLFAAIPVRGDLVLSVQLKGAKNKLTISRRYL